MESNLDKIALDLYGKIQTRFRDIKIGDEEANVLSKKEDIPKARFFEFEYTEDGDPLGTIAITLDATDGVIVQVSGDLVDDKKGRMHGNAYKFIRSFKPFARQRLLNFDIQNLSKSNLDKRDYQFQAKRKEIPTMPAIMENKMYGTSRLSYQDLDGTRLIVRHNQAINPELPAGRTMHIESVYIETANGERFRYPYKNLSGARALAEHLKNSGTPYDNIGKHIISLSEELANLRKFKNYVGRQEQISEAMGEVTGHVMERIEALKKEINNLQRPSYYSQFVESFEEKEDQMIPEEIMNDWIDRLTIRTFNEELKSSFPYIYKLVGENIPVKELSPEDMLGEDDKEDTPHSHQAKTTLKHLKKASYGDKADAANIKPGIAGYRDRIAMLKRAEEEDNLNELRSEEKDEHGNVVRWKEEGEWTPIKKEKNGRGKVTNLSDKARRETEKLTKKEIEEAYLESFMNSIVTEDEMSDSLFSPNKDAQHAAIEKLNTILSSELKGGPDGVNATESLKGIIDDPKFLMSLRDIDPDLDVRPLIQQYILAHAPDIMSQIHFDGSGADEAPPPAPEAPPAAAPAPEATPPAPEAGAAPAAAPAPEEPPPGAPAPAPMAESADAKAKLKAKFIKAKECGAKLDTQIAGKMTLHDMIRECGLTPIECGFDDGDDHSDDESGFDQIKKSIQGFWNPEEKNFTIGGTRAKIKVIDGFKAGEFSNATEDDVKNVCAFIDHLDPSHMIEKHRIMKLAGIGGPEITIDELDEDANSDFASMMQQFMQSHQDVNPDQLLSKFKQDHPDAVGTQQMPKMNIGGHDFDFNNPQAMQGQIGNMMKGMQSQVPNQNIQFPGGQMNPTDMMKQIMGKINFGK